MLTPTGVTFAQYWNAIKAGNITHVRFTFLGQNIVLDESDVLVDSGVVLNDVFNGETDLVFGRTLSKQVTVTFINSSKLSSLNWTGEFTLEFGVEISETTNWVTIGYFTGEKPKNVTTVQTIQFTAYDRMIRFETLADEFLKSLTYPKTIQEIYDALCTYIGLQNVAGSELPNIMSRSYASAPADMQGYTCRDLLGFIAEACGCYAKINNAGKVQMVWFTNNTSYAITATEEFNVESGDIHDGFTWDEADTYTWDEFDNFTWDDVCGYQEALRVDGVYVKQLSSDFDIYYPTETVDNVYCIFENPFLSISTASDITAYVAPIYDRLYAFGGYLPVQIECVGNWCVEAGDIITVDVNGITVSFPIFVKEMTWNGAVSDVYDTTANNKRQVYASEATKQRVMTSNKIEMYVSDNYYEKKSGVAIDSDGVTISGSKSVNIESGSSFNVASGGSVDIHAGGTFELTGGTGSILMDSNGVNVSGGKSVKVQSGSSYMNIAAGSIYCQGQSGAIDVQDGRSFRINGFDFTRVVGATEYIYTMSAYNKNNLLLLWLNSASDGTHLNSYGDIAFAPSNQGDRSIRLVKSGNYIVLYGDNGIKLGDHSDARYGDIDYIYGNYIYYNHLSQNSSKEVKHDIKPLESVGQKLDKLNPVTFVYDYDKKEEKRMGLIYEDVIDIMPEICTNDESEKAINYVELIPALLKEIKDLRARVKALEEREV